MLGMWYVVGKYLVVLFITTTVISYYIDFLSNVLHISFVLLIFKLDQCSFNKQFAWSGVPPPGTPSNFSFPGTTGFSEVLMNYIFRLRSTY